MCVSLSFLYSCLCSTCIHCIPRLMYFLVYPLFLLQVPHSIKVSTKYRHGFNSSFLESDSYFTWTVVFLPFDRYQVLLAGRWWASPVDAVLYYQLFQWKISPHRCSCKTSCVFYKPMAPTVSCIASLLRFVAKPTVIESQVLVLIFIFLLPDSPPTFYAGIDFLQLYPAASLTY